MFGQKPPPSLSTGERMDQGHMSSEHQTSSAVHQEQQQSLNDIISLLVSAGYFRARIAGLSDFDKVIGGLCWCITNAHVELDVDILFRENSKIGEKVKLSETIVLVMRKMRCPHALQANQIQGSDWVNVYPVIIWMVKKFFENRELVRGGGVGGGVGGWVCGWVGGVSVCVCVCVY